MYYKGQVKYTRKELVEHYTQLQNPAVSMTRFLQRVMQSGWSLERAASTKEQRSSGLAQRCAEFYNAIPLEKRGVCYDTFYTRVVRGWDMQKAALEHTHIRSAHYREYYDRHPNPQVEFSVFYVRAHAHNWDFEKAITTPVIPNRNGKPWCAERVFYESNKSRAQVDFSVFYNRVKTNKWEMEAALTIPKKEPVNRKEILRSFYDNYPDPQVTFKTFIERVSHNGWSPQMAILSQAKPTTKNGKPISPRQQRLYEAREFYRQQRERSVVSVQTFVERVCTHGWEMERALTVPLSECQPPQFRKPVSTQALQTAFANFCRPHQSASV